MVTHSRDKVVMYTALGDDIELLYVCCIVGSPLSSNFKRVVCVVRHDETTPIPAGATV